MAQAKEIVVQSPAKRVEVRICADDQLSWSVSFDHNTVVYPSRLGLLFKDQKPFGKMKVNEVKTSSVDKTWKNPRSKKSTYIDHCTETVIAMEEEKAPSRKLNLIVRAYEDGLAFRYQIPEQEGFKKFVLLEDQTEFGFPADSVCWASDHEKFNTSQERHFLKKDIKEISKDAVVICPLVVESKKFGCAAVSEADLISWAGMQFAAGEKKADDVCNLRLRLTPRRDGNGVVVSSAPVCSPWRVILLGKKPVDLINNSGIILNVSTPSKIADTSWIKPGTSSWDWWSEGNIVINTETFKDRVDLAHKMGWKYTTLDDPWYFNSMFQRKPGLTVDTTKGCGTIDIEEALRYSKEKGIGIFAWLHYKDLIACGREKTFAAYEKWGFAGVKVDFMDSDCQETVDWCLDTVKIAAKHHLMVNFHGMYKPTGLERTWPNQITREGILGNEYNKFSKKITSEHCATLPFTRFLVGPGDFTPGGFLNVQPEKFSTQKKLSVPPCKEMGTRAHALAMCMITDSPILTICDKSDHYKDQPGSSFLKNIPPVWDNTTALAGEISQYYLVQRQSGDLFYAAAITNEDPRDLSLPLTFLKKGTKYKVEIFADTPESAVEATKIALSEKEVSSADVLKIRMERNGGWCAIFRPIP